VAAVLPETRRSGSYYRVCDPDWTDCADTTFAKAHGGRWNPPGAFGALYLNATLRVAAANARRAHAGRAIGLFDLRPEERPHLATFLIPSLRVVDAVGDAGVRELGFPPTFPVDVDWAPCQAIAAHAYANGFDGAAARSAAEARFSGSLGEELAVFDTHVLAPTDRVPFHTWYPDPAPL
jgi:RES domain-containing protein